jgi:spermidine synthase
MKPFTILECVVTPDGRELVLSRRGDAFHIHVDRYELMASRGHGSEEELARLALAALPARPAPSVLVGGLGMGYTLRACLDGLGPGATVTVAEVFPAVVAWNEGVLGALAGHPLADPRVRVVQADVTDAVARAETSFDAILLDVDNGPEAITLESNRRLYSPAGLRALHTALAPGGVLAVWSADDDPRFADRVERTGFSVATRFARARPGRGARHVVFVARRT